MMKTLKSSVLCVEIKCLGTIMASLPVKAARLASMLRPEGCTVQTTAFSPPPLNQNKVIFIKKLLIISIYISTGNEKKFILGRRFIETCLV